jgi:uncharacterized repeat protein (TIGR01451 family)
VFLRQEGDRVVFAVGSGSYVFTNIPPANLTMKLITDKRVVQPGDPLLLYMTVRNEGPETATNVSIGNRLSPELALLSTPGLSMTDGLLTGRIAQLDPGNQVTYSMLLRPTAPGTYRQTAQVTATDQFDPTSIPNSGTGDGEDDMAAVDFRTAQADPAVFTSPNPFQTPLPAVLTNQPRPDSTKADLSLLMQMSQTVLNVSTPAALSLLVTHQGGRAVTGVTLRLTLPPGVSLADGSATGSSVSLPVAGTLVAGQTTPVVIMLRADVSQSCVLRGEVSAASIADPDSTPNNGLTNGEDDTAQLQIRVR